MNQATLHDRRAEEIVSATCWPDVALDTGRTPTRQGDVVLRRRGDAPTDGPYAPTPACGFQVAAGAHGEHRLFCPAMYTAEDGGLVCLQEARLVHTDAPEGRHGPKRLAPGHWRISRVRELSLEDVIVQVTD